MSRRWGSVKLFCYNAAIPNPGQTGDMNRSTAALIIAILFHLLLLLLLFILTSIVPETAEQKPQQNRIKIALKEKPKAKRNAALENKIPPAEKIPPMPKGAQLEKIEMPSERTKTLPKPSEQIPVEPAAPVQPQQKIPTPKKIAKPEKRATDTEPLPPEKPYIPFMKAPEPEQPAKPEETAEANATSIPDEHRKLFSKLSKKQKYVERKTASETSSRRESRIPNDIREAYGDAFGKLTEGEKKYLLDNQEIMRRLTQSQLDDTGPTMIPNNLRVNDYNVVEFYLHPDGSMTDFRYIRRSGFFLLDEVTKETIESVYWKYPRPEQKTLIRYKFGYFLRGY
jgi:protein TonB